MADACPISALVSWKGLVFLSFTLINVIKPYHNITKYTSSLMMYPMHSLRQNHGMRGYDFPAVLHLHCQIKVINIEYWTYTSTSQIRVHCPVTEHESETLFRTFPKLIVPFLGEYLIHLTIPLTKTSRAMLEHISFHWIKAGQVHSVPAFIWRYMATSLSRHLGKSIYSN